MNNIFENAYFGKVYKTKDGRKAIYWKYESLERWHILIIENSLLTAVFSNGKMCSQIDCNRDIVSEWQEEINEKELNKLAEEFCDKEYENPVDINKSQNGLELGYANLLNCYEAGYRKALEQL